MRSGYAYRRFAAGTFPLLGLTPWRGLPPLLGNVPGARDALP